jgi:hypothetical protein
MAKGCARVMGQMSTCLTNPGSDARMCSFTLCAWAPAQVGYFWHGANPTGKQAKLRERQLPSVEAPIHSSTMG